MYRSQYCCILVRCSAVVNDKYNYRPTHFFPLTDVADEARQSQKPQKTQQFHKSNDPQRSTCRHASTDLLATWRNNMLNYAKLCRLWMLRNCLDIVQLGVGRQTILLSLSFSSYFVIAIFSGELFWCQLSIYVTSKLAVLSCVDGSLDVAVVASFYIVDVQPFTVWSAAFTHPTKHLF